MAFFYHLFPNLITYSLDFITYRLTVEITVCPPYLTERSKIEN